VVKIPVGSEALQRPDCNWLVELAAAAPSLAGMMTDTPTDGGEGVALPDCLDGLEVFTVGNVGYILGDIDTNRAGMLTGRYHQRIADSSRALLLLYVGFIFVSKVIYGGEHGVRTGLPQAT